MEWALPTLGFTDCTYSFFELTPALGLPTFLPLTRKPRPLLPLDLPVPIAFLSWFCSRGARLPSFWAFFKGFSFFQPVSGSPSGGTLRPTSFGFCPHLEPSVFEQPPPPCCRLMSGPFLWYEVFAVLSLSRPQRLCCSLPVAGLVFRRSCVNDHPLFLQPAEILRSSDLTRFPPSFPSKTFLSFVPSIFAQADCSNAGKFFFPGRLLFFLQGGSPFVFDVFLPPWAFVFDRGMVLSLAAVLWSSRSLNPRRSAGSPASSRFFLPPPSINASSSLC